MLDLFEEEEKEPDFAVHITQRHAPTDKPAQHPLFDDGQHKPLENQAYTSLIEQAHAISQSFARQFDKEILLVTSDDVMIDGPHEILERVYQRYYSKNVRPRGQALNAAVTEISNFTNIHRYNPHTKVSKIIVNGMNLPDAIFAQSLLLPINRNRCEFMGNPICKTSMAQMFGDTFPDYGFIEGELKLFALLHEHFHAVLSQDDAKDTSDYENELYADLGACLVLYRLGYADIFSKIIALRADILDLKAATGGREIQNYTNAQPLLRFYETHKEWLNSDSAQKMNLRQIKDMALHSAYRFALPEDHLRQYWDRKWARSAQARADAVERISKRSQLLQAFRENGLDITREYTETTKAQKLEQPEDFTTSLDGLRRAYQGRILTPQQAQNYMQEISTLYQQYRTARTKLAFSS